MEKRKGTLNILPLPIPPQSGIWDETTVEPDGTRKRQSNSAIHFVVF
jgi:hypothetical protein